MMVPWLPYCHEPAWCQRVGVGDISHTCIQPHMYTCTLLCFPLICVAVPAPRQQHGATDSVDQAVWFILDASYHQAMRRRQYITSHANAHGHALLSMCWLALVCVGRGLRSKCMCNPVPLTSSPITCATKQHIYFDWLLISSEAETLLPLLSMLLFIPPHPPRPPCSSQKRLEPSRS